MIFAATRYFLIGVLLVLNIAILILSSSVFIVANSDNVYRPIYVYLIFLGAFSCVFLIPIALIDLFRQGAIPSRVLFELGWLVVFWILHLAGASFLTATPQCGASGTSCDEAQRTLLIFAWLAVADLLVHLAALLVITLLHVNDIPEVWSMGFRDVPWFSKRSEGITPYTQERSIAQDGHGGSQHPRHQQSSEQPQPRHSQSQPWHGRRRSRVRSWRDRYPSDSFSSQDRDNQNPPDGGDAVDPARAFYPFLGQGPDANELRRAHEEAVLPLPVAFTFERTRAPPQQPAQPTTQTRSLSRRASNVRTEQPQVRQLPRTPEPEEQPPSQSRTALPPLPPLPPPQSSQRPLRRVSNREAPQLVPLDISRALSQRQQQTTSSAHSRGPPADSVLFSTSLQQHERPRRGAPPSATRLLPETTAFYGTAVQSVMRDQEENETAYGGESGEDRRSTTTRRVYASTPQPKPMSEAQAYAAEATRRSRTTAGSSRRGRR